MGTAQTSQTNPAPGQQNSTPRGGGWGGAVSRARDSVVAASADQWRAQERERRTLQQMEADRQRVARRAQDIRAAESNRTARTAREPAPAANPAARTPWG